MALASVSRRDPRRGRLSLEGITRSFTSFSQAARESADSRVYASIHFRSACEDGLVLGRKVGQRTVTLSLQPARK